MDVNPDRLVVRARECFDAGDAYGAVHLLKEVVDAGQGFADAYNLLGLSYSIIGKRDEAVREFDRALALNPRYVEAHLNRAVTLSELGRDQEAAETFASAQKLGAVDHTGFSAPMASRLANLHAELAEAYVEAGGLVQAIVQLEEAVELRPEFVDLRYRLARLRLDNGQIEKAHHELEKMLHERPNNVAARASLGMACYLMKDMGGARAAWEACQEAAPDDPKIAAYLKLLARVGG
ncbi:MAG: tetratricopeptide repeat protein [Gemmatimonadales bacterium]|nr:tetratricopeptide repeat protein [Gemmatimonadales bacterium]